MRDTSPRASASQSSPSAGLGSLVANAAAAARARDPGHTDDENSKVVDTPVLRWGPRRGVEGLKCPERAVSKDHPLLFVALDRKAAQSEPTTSPNEALAALSTSDGTFRAPESTFLETEPSHPLARSVLPANTHLFLFPK